MSALSEVVKVRQYGAMLSLRAWLSLVSTPRRTRTGAQTGTGVCFGRFPDTTGPGGGGPLFKAAACSCCSCWKKLYSCGVLANRARFL